MFTKRVCGSLVALVALAVGLGLVVLIGPYSKLAVATPSVVFEGLPIEFSLIEVTSIGSNQTKVRYRSVPFVGTLTDDPALLHDPGEYLGQMGTYGDGEATRVWLRVPEGQTLSVFPGHLPEGVVPKQPEWLATLIEYRDAHPDVRLVTNPIERPLQLVAGQWSPRAGYQETPPPVGDCDMAQYLHSPFAVEVEAVIEGDISSFSFPSQSIAYLYRVPRPVLP